MAVSPQDLLALTQADLQAVGHMEKMIDDKLQANYEPGGECKINISNIGDQIKCNRVTLKMKKEIISRYQAVGWAVSFDPGTPDYITFSGPAGPPPKPDVVPPMSAEQILDKMAEAKNTGGGVKPPTFNPVTRDSSPYSRTQLASKPPI